MSNPYPSRRELRLQREREERAVLRDQEAQRWAEEVEDREQRAVEAQRQADETLAKAEPVPASQAREAPEDTTNVETDEEEFPAGRRAAAKPVDSASDPVATDETTVVPRRRRRADSQVTSTGMLPLITKQRDERDETKPRSRKEARALAERASAEREAEIETLQEQAEQQQAAPPKPVRRATAPQAPPPPVPAATAEPVETEQPADSDDPDVAPEDTIVLSTSELYAESATEITDMTGLDTLEVRRAELRAETEKLTQEIIQLGQENPNVIDPLLLRRQKELAEKSQELQDLETSAITIIDDGTEDATDESDGDSSHDAVAGTEHAGVVDADVNPEAPEPTKQSSDDDVEIDSVTGSDVASSEDTEEEQQPARRSRRASSGPMITGPFEVTEDDDDSVEAVLADAKPDFASHFEPQTETDTISTTGPEKPLQASSAHGLDTLDPKESEAPERRLLAVSVIVFAVGIVALIIALILLTR